MKCLAYFHRYCPLQVNLNLIGLSGPCPIYPQHDQIADIRNSDYLPDLEIAPVHSITSSARASRVCGTVRPSAFAVLRLITNSYLVGACTGRSDGFSPFRMRST